MIPAATDQRAPFRLTVLNPGGRDPRQDFSGGTPGLNDDGHAPVNFHAYAACTGGVFHRETKGAIAEGLPVLLLLRGDFRETERALQALQSAGLTTAISFKESGLHQIAAQLSDAKRAARFQKIVAAADGVLAATSDALAFFPRAQFIPTPYPVEDKHWSFSRPPNERAGIFIGTREWQVPSRHHPAALALAAQLRVPVTVFAEEPRRCRQFWRSLGGEEKFLRLLTKRLRYRDYLAEMARHKIVLQADKSAVPGQVAGDALLCRLPCVGGDGAIERIAFPRSSGFGRSLGELRELACRLLEDQNFYDEVVTKSQELAREKLAFAPVAAELQKFFHSLGAGTPSASK